MSNHKEKIILIIILLLALGARLYLYDANYYGEDYFYHYSVVEQSLERGKLSSQNDLVVCYEGAKEGHPIGYYILPYLLGKLIGIQAAFFIIPIFFGVLTIFLVYSLIRLLFGIRVAQLTAFFLAVSIAHIVKSIPHTYRGDNSIYPFILGSLICLCKALKEKEQKKGLRYAMLAGLISGSSMVMWNGYPLLIIIYVLTLFCYLTYTWVKAQKSSKEQLKRVVVSLGIQAIIMAILFLIFKFYGKGYDFFLFYYPAIIVGCVSYLYVLHKSLEKRSYWLLGGYILLVGVAALILREKIYLLYAGFGSIKVLSIFAFELLKPSASTFYFFFFITILLAVLGLLKWIRLDENKVFFLGFLIPSLYLATAAFRYLFFSSVAIATLAALFLATDYRIKKKEIMKYGRWIVVLIMVIYPFVILPPTVITYETRLVQAFDFIEKNTAADACIVTYPNKGAAVEYFTKRHIYAHSLGVVLNRETKISGFLLSNETEAFNLTESFFLLQDTDLNYIEVFADQVNANLSDVAVSLSKVAKNVYAPPAKDAAFIYIEDEKGEKKFFYAYENKLYPLKASFVNGELYTASEGLGCIYTNTQTNMFIYFGSSLCDTNLYKMATGQKIEGAERVYFKEGIALYKITSDRQKTESQE